MKLIACLASRESRARDLRARPLDVYALISVFAALGCSSVTPVEPHAVRARVEALQAQRASPPRAAAGSPEGQRETLLGVLRSIQLDFGTTLTPRQLASRLATPARSAESVGVWMFEPQAALFQVDANAMSIDSPVDWLRVTLRPELQVHLTDLTQLFSHDYDVSRAGAELLAVEFTSNQHVEVAAELRNDRTAYLTSAPVVSVQLRRPGYDPSVARLAPAPR